MSSWYTPSVPSIERKLSLVIPLLFAVGCSGIDADAKAYPVLLPETTPTASATATVTATFTATKTNTQVPTSTAVKTETPRPTATRTTTRTAVKTTIPTPTRTGTPEAKPTLLQLDGKSMVQAIPIRDGTELTVPAGQWRYAVVGRKGVKVKDLEVVSFFGNGSQIESKMYAPESLNQLREFLAGRTDDKPGNVGALIYRTGEGKYEHYSGKTGSSDGFLTIFKNLSRQDAHYKFAVTEEAAFCDNYDTITYNEGFWWTTCDPNWTAPFKGK